MPENQAVKIRFARGSRWRCRACGASTTLSYDDAAARLGKFLAWLTSKGTRVQKRPFHAFSQVKRYTTSRPRVQAGREPCALATEPMYLDTLRQADWWVERCMQWCGFWANFLEDVSVVDGRRRFANERLRKARPSLSRLVCVWSSLPFGKGLRWESWTKSILCD